MNEKLRLVFFTWKLQKIISKNIEGTRINKTPILENALIEHDIWFGDSRT